MPIHQRELESCPFCASDPSRILEETELTRSLLNVPQFETGQAIVIPKRHASTLGDLTAEESVAVMGAARRLYAAMLAAFDPDGVLLYQNNGMGSGQRVPHFHLHLVPRRQGSEWGVGPPHLAHIEGRRPEREDPLPAREQDLAVIAQLRAQLRSLS